MLNNRRQSVGPNLDSRPRLEGARHKFLTKLLTSTQPFLTLQSCIHSHTSLTKLLPSLGQHIGPAYKRHQRMGPEQAGPLPEGTEQQQHSRVMQSVIILLQ